jgi:hypothetical protein
MNNMGSADRLVPILDRQHLTGNARGICGFNLERVGLNLEELCGPFDGVPDGKRSPSFCRA